MADQSESPDLMGMVQNFIGNKSKDEVQKDFESAGSKMDSGERTNIMSTVLGELQSKGFDRQNVASQAGLSSSNPDQMGAGDVGRIFGFVKDKAPYIIPMIVQKFPQLGKYLGMDTSGGIGGIAGKLFGGENK